MLDGTKVAFIGEVNDKDKEEFLGNAAALLFPIDWPEPFGLVMIEAMSCGTPVIAMRRGSVPEIIEDGVTGFVVDNDEQGVRAIARLGELDRNIIRREFSRRFMANRMALEYVQHFRTAIAAYRRSDFRLFGNGNRIPPTTELAELFPYSGNPDQALPSESQ